jgi:hypothetical protein
MHHLQHSEFKMEALLLLVSEFIVRSQGDLQKTGQVFFAELFCEARNSGAFIR